MLKSGYILKSFEQLDSTNSEAKRLLALADHRDDLDKVVIWAKTQTTGRGRYDRNWISPEGNLYFSIIIKPEVDLDQIYQLSFVTALAVHDAITEFLPNSELLKCKWPNDVLLNGQKLSGILLEKIDDSMVIVGIGINVASYPEGVEFPATALNKHTENYIKIDILLEKVINNFNNRLLEWQTLGFSVIRSAWLKRAYGIGSCIKVRVFDNLYSGIFKDISRNGELILSEDSGIDRLISAGDVFF